VGGGLKICSHLDHCEVTPANLAKGTRGQKPDKRKFRTEMVGWSTWQIADRKPAVGDDAEHRDR
jgi:hypothetical protein